MNILFLTLEDFHSLDGHGINQDLLREFVTHGHHVYVISPTERRNSSRGKIIKRDKLMILKPLIGNIQKVGLIEKGISTVAIESLLVRAVKTKLKDVKIDLVLYNTPPITFCSVVEYVVERDSAQSYLLLKDIFPQNSVDLGMLSKKGVKGVLYRCFRKKEKRLYKISDRIGCMSQANVDYVLKHNFEVAQRDRRTRRLYGYATVEICPNSAKVVDLSVTEDEKRRIRDMYNIPQDKKVFIYGGNLGKPQGIDFMIQCLHSQADNKDAYFFIVGNGTEYGKVEEYIRRSKVKNVALHNWLPKEDYDRVVASCDVGLIFLEHRFTIPNFPSRLLEYMKAKLPVLAVTDLNTDVGKVITDNGFGWWCESNDTDSFGKCLKLAMQEDLLLKGCKGFDYLMCHYNVESQYEKIIKVL